MERAGRKSRLEYTGIERLDFLGGQPLYWDMTQCRENMVIENTPIPEIATYSECGGMHFFKPLLQEVLELLFWTRRQCAMPLLIKHLIARNLCLSLRLVVTLFGFPVFQDDLCNPLFPFAVLALKHGAGAMRARPALPALPGLLVFVGVLFVS